MRDDDRNEYNVSKTPYRDTLTSDRFSPVQLFPSMSFDHVIR